jgi:hypothetical protein
MKATSPLLSSAPIQSPIPQRAEIGREEEVDRRADHRLPARSRSGRGGEGTVPAARVQPSLVRPVSQQVQRDERAGNQVVACIVLQAADLGGHAAQGGLRAGAAGFAQGDELGRDFDEQDVGRLELRLGLGHDGPPFRPTPGVDAIGESNPHRAQARQGLRSNSPRP